MSIIEGKWKLVSETNMEAFYDATGAPQGQLREIHGASLTDPKARVDEMVIDLKEKVIDRKIYIDGELKRKVVHYIGVDEEMKTPEGRILKGRCDLVGDNKITYDNKIDDFRITGSLEAEGDDLTVTMLTGDVTALQKFTRL